MWRRNFLITLTIFIGLCLGTVVINILIDPYDVWNDERRLGFNLCAYRDEDLERLTKPIRINQFKPETIFIGNSKTDFGLNPDYVDSKIYNLSLRNGQPHEILKFIEHAYLNGTRKIFLALDFEMFADSREIMPGFDSEQLETTHMTRKNLFLTTLSFDAIRDSVITFRKNSDELPNFRTIKLNGEYDDRFLQIIFDNEHEFLATTRQLIVEAYKLENSDTMLKKFQDFEQILEFCHENQIQLVIFIPPVHSTHIEGYSLHRDMYEAWLKKLVETSDIPIIDFVAINPITTDEKFFWNSSHMKNSVGNMILDQLIFQQPSELTFETLSAENIDSHLKNLWTDVENSRDDRLKYLGRFSPEIPAQIENQIESELFKIDWITLEKDILSVRGKIELPRDEILHAYIVIENFYSQLINLDSKTDSSYNFFTESILPIGIDARRAKIVVVTRSSGVLMSEFFNVEAKN